MTGFDMTIVIGTTEGGRKVHMAQRRDAKVLCELTTWGALVDNTIAELDDNGGLDETIAVIDEHRIAVSRLCGHCFSMRLRHKLAAQRRAAKTR